MIFLQAMLMRYMCTHCFSWNSGVGEEREEGERLSEREPSISRQAHCRQSCGKPTLGERAVISWHRFSHVMTGDSRDCERIERLFFVGKWQQKQQKATHQRLTLALGVCEEAQLNGVLTLVGAGEGSALLFQETGLAG